MPRGHAWKINRLKHLKYLSGCAGHNRRSLLSDLLSLIELGWVTKVVTLRTQHAKTDVPVARVPDFWPHATTCWFLVLEAQFSVHRINRQDVQYEILTHWLTERIAISVSDVLLGPMSNTPYTNLNMATLHQTSSAKQPKSTNQAYTEPDFEDQQSFLNATAMNTETVHAEEVEIIPEQPTKSIEPTVHPETYISRQSFSVPSYA